ncbi:hypothetical protein [Bacteroides heparinolyticus]|uniref:hypothetical protein n=1 Tax=Prevotella heparinolytica TaxID=28113 RepID=UPI0023F0C836|nr:hypothetical protein [Bacteroides heparinolyticus]
MSVTITSRAIPSNPRSKNYPSGAIVYNSGDSTTVMQDGGESVDVIGKDDFREMTDKNVLSSLRALAEIRSRIIKKEDNTPTGDDNVFSSLRTLEEVNKVIVSLLEALEEKYLSKTRSDRTPYSLEVGEDLTVDGNASVNHDLNVGRNATIAKDLTVMEILRALIKIETASLNVSGNSKTGTLDVAGKATARDVEVANQVTSLNAVIRALATIHNLTVDNTADIMHGIIRQYLSSDKFVSGFLGEGFKVWKDAAGLWHGELDMLTVRKVFMVFELVVQKVVHQGGMVIRSAAGGKLTKVTDGGSYWKCEHDSTDDFVKDDQVLCQVFTGTKMKRYWRLVTSAGAGYFNLSKTDCEAGSATPEVGDEVAVLGNRTNTARQSAQIDCAVGANAPYRDDYAGINSYSLAGKLVTRTGNLSGIVDPDFGALSGYGLYALNAYLKGMLRLTSGKTVETAIGEARSGAISVAASDAQAKADAAKASAIAAAAGDAQAKADAAKQAAISAAASDAQSKAMAAETNAKTHAQAILDSLQIGGRNLYRKSTVIHNLINNPTIQKEVDADSAHGFKLTGKQSLVCGVRIRNVISENGDYVISFWGKSNGSGSPKFDICNNPCTGDATFTTEWKRFELRAKVNNYTADGYHFIDIENLAYLVYWFRDFKVEKGTKATDWTPAPEDVEADATAKADAAKQSAISDAAAKYPTKTEYSAQLAVLNSSISSKVSQTDFNALGTRMSTAEEKITPASIISTVSSTVESAKTAAINAAASDAQAKADAAKQAAISTAANDATAKANAAENNAKAHANSTFTPLTTYNTKIAQLENSINLKAESSTVSGLTTRMAVAEEKITPGAINMVVKEQITTAVNNVQVGGRNYVILSKLQSWIAATSVPVVTGTDVNMMLTKDNTTSQFLILRIKDYVPETGTYTVSGYMTIGGRPAKNADFLSQSAHTVLENKGFRVDDATGYFEGTHVYNGNNPWLLYMNISANTGTPVKIGKFKFEKGNKASDWTLSPEDADAALRIGGRNLYRKSTVINNLGNNPTIQKEADADSVHGFKLTGKQSLVCAVRIKNVISENGDYVISFWGKSNGSGSPKFDICNNPCTGDATFTTEWKRFELRAKVNNYTADGYHFIDIENLAYLVYWFRDFKVEKGTKATDWTPAPEDVEADIALRPTKEEIKAGISITTGGINVFGKEISLAGKVTFASLDSSTQATINGKATTAALTSLQNSLGAMAYQNMVSLAKLDTTIVQGGYIKTNLIDANAVITNSLLATKIAATDITTGRLTVIDGAKIAGFRVSGNNLSNMDNAGNFLNDASIVFRNDTMKCFAGIGGNVMPASSGLRAVARFENEDTSDQWGLRANYALIVSAKGAKRYDDMVESGNHAIYISNGDICGLRLKARRISVNTTLTTMDSIVFVVKTGVTVTLPGSGVEDGQIYFIRNHCGGACRIAGNNIRAWNDGGVGNSFELNRSNMAILMYDAHNNSWTANWTGNW